MSRSLEAVITPSGLQAEGDALEMSRRIPQALRESGFKLGPAVRKWANRFSRIQDDYPPVGEPVLSIYGSCIDRAYTITQGNVQKFIDSGVKAAAEFDKTTEKDAVEKIQGIVDAEKPPGKASNAVEVMGLIIRRMIKPTSDKTSVANKELDAWLEKTFKILSPQDNSGGASANIAVNTPREPFVLAVEHNSKQMAETLPENIKRFSTKLLSDGMDSLLPMTKDVGDDPMQVNHPIEFSQGIKFKFNGVDYQTFDHGRMIVGASGVFTKRDNPDSSKWVPAEKPSSFIVDEKGKPITDDKQLKTIGESFKKVIFNGLHYVKPDQFELMKTQINGVKSGGALTHAELSGISSDFSKLAYMTGVLKDTVDSMAFNDGETILVLKALKQHLGADGEGIVVDNNEGSEAQVKNGMVITEKLGLKRLHIHGQNFDVILRKDASAEDLRAEVVGGMWQKYQIYKKLTGEPSEADVAPNLKQEAIVEMMSFAAKFTAGMDSKTITGFSGKKNVEPDEGGKIAAELIKSLVEDGYVQNKGGYSIILLPPKWIYGDRKLYPTGAGDTASGNQFVYSGMYSETKATSAEEWYGRAHIGTYFEG